MDFKLLKNVHGCFKGTFYGMLYSFNFNFEKPSAFGKCIHYPIAGVVTIIVLAGYPLVYCLRWFKDKNAWLTLNNIFKEHVEFSKHR